MCIQKVEAWAFAGRNYTTEAEAVTAALVAIGEAIVTTHSRNPVNGLIEHGDDLVKLLARRAELFPKKPTIEDDQKDPSTGKDRAARCSLLLQRIQAWGQRHDIQGDVAAKTFIAEKGYENLSQISNTATAGEIAAMHAELDRKGIA